MNDNQFYKQTKSNDFAEVLLSNNPNYESNNSLLVTGNETSQSSATQMKSPSMTPPSFGPPKLGGRSGR
jgi:hypothetical protein